MGELIENGVSTGPIPGHPAPPADPAEPARDPTSSHVETQERRTSPVELLWDLVFVFAITQVTTLLSAHPSWSRFGESMIALALVWWAWSAFVWAANAQETDSPTLRISLLLATVLIFITGLALPHAFGTESTLFAVSYAFVRFLHLALYTDASRRGNASWSAIAGFAVTVSVGMALLIAGSFLTGAVRAVLWTAALAIDYAGPAWLTRERLRGLQEVAVAHFAERYSLFIIICLGESIVAVGPVATRQHPGAALIGAVALSLLCTIGMWWTYFDRFAATAEARLREHEDPVLAAADAYSYLHLVLVAGIIIFAVGVKLVAHGAADHLGAAGRLTLCGGVALYLAGHFAFTMRIARQPGYPKLIVAALLLVLIPLGAGFAAWLLTGAVAVLLAVMCLTERAATGTAARGTAAPGTAARETAPA